MTAPNWYKWTGVELNKILQTPQVRPKVIRGFDQLDGRLRAVIREQDAEKTQKRKQAGQSQKKRKRKTKKQKKTPRPYVFQGVAPEDEADRRRRMAKVRKNQFQFRSHPVPDFERSRKRQERRRLYLNSLQTITIPQTPRTLSHSMDALVKREQEQMAHKEPKRMPTINHSISTKYLHRQPFMPRIESTFIRTKPFHLRSEERAEKRRLFDEQNRLAMEKKLEEQATEYYEQDRIAFLRLRSQTNFKARPWKRTPVSQ